MSAGPRVTDGVRRFVFDGDAGLYRDQRGMTVVADVEGEGRYAVVPPDSLAEVWADEEPNSPMAGTFGRSLLVAARSSVPFCVDVFHGPGPELAGLASTQVRGALTGSGWVLSADGELILDGVGECHAGPFPAPFFFGADFSGSGEAVVMGPTARLVAEFSADDAGKDFTVQNASAVRELVSTFGNGTVRTGRVLSHLNAAKFPVRGLSGSSLILRRTYDRFHGRQRARVWVGDTMAGWWYDPAQDRTHRWGISTFGVSAEILEGRTEATITIDPPAGSALWSLSSLSVFETD